MKKVKVVCSLCGSENVSADAATRWSVAHQEWEVTNVFDKGHLCDDCGGECGIREVEIVAALEEPDPTQPLRDACRRVLATWEDGDLAAAVDLMERELDILEGVEPPRQARPRTDVKEA